ncbi:MAG: hypothetical protein LBF71_05525 [Campylobacteraceae bacterium]|jgi:hypothetical protein|nr:hypothetical protein [Campylobacteraceae bacterium]
MPNIRVKILKNTAAPGENLFKDKVYDLPKDQADILVQLGKAVIDKEVEVEIKGKKSGKAKKDFSDDELKKKAKELDIELDGTETRDEILELIDAFEGE